MASAPRRTPYRPLSYAGLCTLLGLATAGRLGAQTVESTLPPAAELTNRFEAGEVLSFDAKYGFITVGNAQMRALGKDTLRDEAVFHFQFQLTGGTFFYRLNDRMDSWVGVDDFASRRFHQDFDEGGKRRYAEYDIFPDSGTYRQAGVDTAMATSPEPLDDAAFFYFVRTLPMDPGRRYEFNRYFRPDRNPVVLEVVERDTIDVPAGRFPAIIVRPIIKGRGIFAEAANARLWISDDERRLIVQMKSTFPFGTITLRLTGIETAGPEVPETS